MWAGNVQCEKGNSSCVSSFEVTAARYPLHRTHDGPSCSLCFATLWERTPISPAASLTRVWPAPAPNSTCHIRIPFDQGHWDLDINFHFSHHIALSLGTVFFTHLVVLVDYSLNVTQDVRCSMERAWRNGGPAKES